MHVSCIYSVSVSVQICELYCKWVKWFSIMGDVWYIIEFIFSVSCWWTASKMYVCVCVWLRAAAGMWRRREAEVVAYRIICRTTVMMDVRSHFLPEDVHTSLSSLSPPFHSTILSFTLIFLPMTHSCFYIPTVFSFLPHCSRSELSLPSSPFIPSVHYYHLSSQSSSPPLAIPGPSFCFLLLHLSFPFPSLHPSFWAIKQ